VRSARDRLRSRRGQSLTEYAFLLALVAIGVVIILLGIGTHIQSIYSKASTALGAAEAASIQAGGGGGASGATGAATGGGGSAGGGNSSNAGGGAGSTPGGGGTNPGGGGGGSVPTPGIVPP
jgi:Flp pilus assembly pilin Flp